MDLCPTMSRESVTLAVSGSRNSTKMLEIFIYAQIYCYYLSTEGSEGLDQHGRLQGHVEAAGDTCSL